MIDQMQEELERLRIENEFLHGLRKTADAAVLCYIKGQCAYFTTQPLDKQCGDDWNDAPYEWNAGEPYDPLPERNENRKIVRIYFESGMSTPDANTHNSPYSVEQINALHVPWLSDFDGEREPIFAGITVAEFRERIKKAGGKTFSEDK